MSTLGNTAVSPEKMARTAVGGHFTASAGNMSENPGVEQSGEACENTIQNLNQSECREKTPGQPRKRKSISGSPISSTRLLRSKSKEKSGASEANNTVVTHDATEEKKRKRRKKKHSKHIAVNEFTRIRGHLRYLLQRITYEQTLIEAYSGEGWKGQSLEKIKLEKELQRAKTHIFRYKLKIRDLFQRLDTLLAQGRLPASLFDNEGEIDSEDIFCAKCRSMDLPADNDIILCDGACERGFHQLCVEPPLLKEDIPPDDEGWLCPGCDCKVDCIDLLNDLQGTNLSVTDSWEKVYPKEAAAAASGEKLDDISGLPSDDSEDDDYNPENPDVEKNDSEDESSSDESDFYSASEDLAEAPPKDDEILGLSSDSEDGDFNPDDPDKDEPVKTESSSSDFTSDSEDFSLIVDTNRLRGDEQGVSSSVDNSIPNSASQEENAKVGKAKRNSLKDELSYLMQSDSPLVSAKRHIERLDYKKLHDETYGNGSSDSSDEDYADGPLPKVRRFRNAKGAMASPSSTPADTKCQSGKQKGSGHTSDSGHSEKLKVGGTGSSKSHSSGKRKTYGEVATKRLYESFKDNQYPDRDAKEKLGKELGLTAYQVSKWFENARHCHRHSSRWNTIMSQKLSKESPSSSQIIGEPLGTESNSIMNDASCNGVEKLEPPKQCLNGEKCHSIDKREGDLLIQEGANGKKSSKPTAKVDMANQELDDTPRNKTSKKQKAKVGTENFHNDDMTDQGSDDTPHNKTPTKLNAKVDTPNSQNVRRSSRLQKQG